MLYFIRFALIIVSFYINRTVTKEIRVFIMLKTFVIIIDFKKIPQIERDNKFPVQFLS